MTDTPDPSTLAAILALPLPRNDAKAATVRDYAVALAAEVWRENEGFSGKRPFGNSGWDYDLIEPVVEAGLATEDDADRLIGLAIASM